MAYSVRASVSAPAHLLSVTKRSLRQLLPYHAIRGIRQAYFRGESFFCPICQTKLRLRFASGSRLPVVDEKQIVGSQYKLNDVCPVCFGSERHRLMYLYIAEETDLLSRGGDVLHIAPEHGLSFMLARRPGVRYVAGDIDPSNYFYIKDMATVDLTALSFDDASFDFVICSHVLEHIPDDAAAIREIRRVLRPDGRALLQVPIALKLAHTDEDSSVTDPAQREARFCQWDHVRLYGTDFGDRLEAQGLSVERYRAFERRPELAKAYDLNPNETLFVARPMARG